MCYINNLSLKCPLNLLVYSTLFSCWVKISVSCSAAVFRLWAAFKILQCTNVKRLLLTQLPTSLSAQLFRNLWTLKDRQNKPWSSAYFFFSSWLWEILCEIIFVSQGVYNWNEMINSFINLFNDNQSVKNK